MGKVAHVGVLLWAALAVTSPVAWGSDAAVWFDQAVRADDEGQAKLAFAQYRRAAGAGLPQAEFNVAAMLDSGRGVDRDFAAAATWYARAAARGNARAAYNLGQLYESGEGVPQNLDAARAWFAASGLEAARSHVATLRPLFQKGELSAPVLMAPGSNAKVISQPDGIELVWTSQSQPEPVSYFVELCTVGASGPHEIYATFASTTSTLAPVPIDGGAYMWRVFTIARKSRSYAASEWTAFTAAAD